MERLASVLQSKKSNFETDLIYPIIEYAAAVAGTAFGTNEKTDISLKVIADHARSLSVMIRITMNTVIARAIIIGSVIFVFLLVS